MVAILGQQIIRRAQKLLRRPPDDGVNLGFGGQGETVEDLGAKGSPGGQSEGFGPVDACEAGAVVTAVGVFFVVEDDA